MTSPNTRLDLIYQVLDNLGVLVKRRATISTGPTQAAKTRLDLIYQVLDNLGVLVKRRATISTGPTQAAKTRLDLIYQVLDNLGVLVRRRATLASAEPEATSTRLQLVYQILDNLGVLVQGQAPDAEIVERVDGILDASLATLAELDIVSVASPGTANPPTGGAFVASTFMPIAAIIANRSAPAFNMAGDASLMALAKIAEDELRTTSRLYRIDGVIDTTLATLETLDVLTVASPGTAGGIGGAYNADVFLPLAAIVAANTAPVAGRDNDPKLIAAAQEAETELRIISRVLRVDGAIDPTLAKLESLDVLTVADPGTAGGVGGTINADIFLPLAAVIAATVAPIAQRGDDPKLIAAATEAQNELRTMSRVLRVDSLIDPTLSLLSALEIYTVGDFGTAGGVGGEIEPEAFLPIAAILANAAAPIAGRAGDPSLQALATLAEGNLRTITRPSRTRKLLRTDTQLRGLHRRHVFNFTTGF